MSYCRREVRVQLLGYPCASRLSLRERPQVRAVGEAASTMGGSAGVVLDSAKDLSGRGCSSPVLCGPEKDRDTRTGVLARNRAVVMPQVNRKHKQATCQHVDYNLKLCLTYLITIQ